MIVLAGTRDASGTNADLALARFTAAGAVDDSTVMDLGGWDMVNGMAFQTLGGDGGTQRIVVAGYASDRPALLRFDAGLNLDATFGDDGVTSASGIGTNFSALAVNAKNEIAVVGSVDYNAGMVARFDADGALVTSTTQSA